jgi:hypothetical protein
MDILLYVSFLNKNILYFSRGKFKRVWQAMEAVIKELGL